MKVLFVKLGALGDAVMARGLATELKRRDPAAHLTWLAGRSIAPLVERFPGVDRVVAVDDAALLTGGVWAAAGALVGAWRRLGFGAYDRVLVGHGDARYRLLALPARGPRTAFLPGVWPRPGRWHGDEYVRLLTLQDHAPVARGAFEPLRVPLDPGLRQALGDGRVALLFPGGARNLLRSDGLKRWPVEHYAALARLLLERGWTVALGGSPADAWVRDAFAGMPVVDLVGRTDLPQSLALCAAAARVVTHDTGPLHLAQAAGAPVTALFGPTAPGSFVDPRADVRVLWGGEDLPCRPCYDGRAFPACPDPVCLVSVSPAAVAATFPA